MRRLACLLIVSAVGCTKSEDPQTGSTSQGGCAELPDLGWVQWMLTSAEAPALMKSSDGAWISFYKRDYGEALRKFEASQEPTAAFAARRTHLRLADLYLELSRFQSFAVANYLSERKQLGAGASPLKNAAFWEALANKKLPENLKSGECKTAESASQYGRLARAFACGEPMACGDAKKNFADDDEMGARETAYYAIACSSDDPREVQKLAAEAADSDMIEQTIDGEKIETRLEYHDPLALFALAQFHLRQARSSQDVLALWADHTEGLKLSDVKQAGDQPQNWVFSEWRSAEDLAKTLRGTATKVSVDSVRTARDSLQAGLTCQADAPNHKTVEDLEVVPALADAAARHATGSPYDDNSCGEALEVLRATLDLSSPDSVGYMNEPAFLVRLAAAAMCRGRTSEAIGALRGVEKAYPEARGALAAAQRLSVVRMMGGSSATQRTQ